MIHKCNVLDLCQLNTRHSLLHIIMYLILLKTYYTKSGDDEGETGRQALPYRSSERGLYSREPWERVVAKSGTDFAICK